MSNLLLLSPLHRGDQTFKNRVFMAPMTRSRTPDRLATDMMADYYAQRASAGLIFTESSQISPRGIGFPFTPGIHTKQQAQAWKRVTDKVHARGGSIYIQLLHSGRVSHPDFLDGELPVAPSAIPPAEGFATTLSGPKPFVKPKALTKGDIQGIVEDYIKSSRLAKDAGFDGIEIHAANGYLPAQFLEDGSNHRRDNYGGSAANRCRFLNEVLEGVRGVWDPGSISVRLSPRNPFNSMGDSDPETTYLHAIGRLEEQKIGMLHFLEPPTLPARTRSMLPRVRKTFSGVLVLNMGYDRSSGEKILQKGQADAIAYGKLFIANPDLPERFEKDTTLNEPDPKTFFTGYTFGYTDYPFIQVE